MLWLIAAAFMLRALLPAGYMTDANALNRGEFTIAFCSADGSIRSGGETDRHGQDADPGDMHCLYGPLKPLALLDPTAQVRVAERVLRVAQQEPAWRSNDRGEAAGPPLGSRAPPTVQLTKQA